MFSRPAPWVTVVVASNEVRSGRTVPSRIRFEKLHRVDWSRASIIISNMRGGGAATLGEEIDRNPSYDRRPLGMACWARMSPSTALPERVELLPGPARYLVRERGHRRGVNETCF